MAKKKFDTQSFTAKFFSVSEEEQASEDKIEESSETEQMQTDDSTASEVSGEVVTEPTENDSQFATDEDAYACMSVKDAEIDDMAKIEIREEQGDYSDKAKCIDSEADSVENTTENRPEEDLREITQVTGKRGRPPKKEGEKVRSVHFSLGLDNDLIPFLNDIVWVKRTNRTQYINDLIRADMEKYRAGK